MNQDEYWDSDFNMRAGFYRETVRHSKQRKPKKARHESTHVQKLRKNVRLHQKPLKTAVLRAST